MARRIVRLRSGGTCELCGRAKATSWAHRGPRSHGGLWTPVNGLDLCGDGVAGCHGWSESHREASYEAGWLLRTGVDPATTPVWLRPLINPPGWYLLAADGTVRWLDHVTEGLPFVPALLPEWVDQPRESPWLPTLPP